MKTIVLGICLALFSLSVGAQGKAPQDKGGKPDREQHENRAAARDAHDGLNLSFSLISVNEARELAVGAGATGYKPLPKGIRKNLARGKPMPPGIQKSRMPGGMLDKLPKQKGYEWRYAGTDLLLVQAGTEIVADVLEDVFR